MVTVINYAERTNSEGKSFVVLQLQGDLEMVQSKETKQFYATARRCSVTSTFSEDIAAKMIGKEIPGSIAKQECEPYRYTLPESGETIQLSHRWVFSPEESTVQSKVIPAPVEVFSNNGVAAFAEA
jgi:hypothetical protein